VASPAQPRFSALYPNLSAIRAVIAHSGVILGMIRVWPPAGTRPKENLRRRFVIAGRLPAAVSAIWAPG
jgi:hypothetical protein